VFLRNALTAAELVTRRDASATRFNEGRDELVRLLKLHGEYGIDVTGHVNAIAAHREWLSAESDEEPRFKDFMSTLSLVMDKYFPDNIQEDGSVRNAEAHTVAYVHFRDSEHGAYYKDDAAMKAVDSHPDQVEDVLRFIDERGSEPFSAEALVEYQRIQPAISEGWL
jgi:hypothetical protein